MKVRAFIHHEWLKSFLKLGLLLPFTSCSLINSVNLSIRYTSPVENIQGRKYVARNLPSSVGLSIKSVDYPLFYAPWDYSLKIKPSFHGEKLEMESRDYRQNQETGAMEHYPNIKMRRFSALINGELTGHTPAGAFSFTIGHGPTITRVKDGESIDILQTTNITKFEISYLGFFAKKWYFNLSARIFESKVTTASAAIKIGYYLGDLP